MGVTPQAELWGFSKSLSRLGELMFVAVESGHADACLLPDVYHIYKGGSDFHGLKLINGRRVHVFHVNDYPAEPPRETIGDADRVYPGDGIAPLNQIFSDMYAAYEGLDDATKAEISDLRVVHSWKLSRENKGRVMSREELSDAPENAHPLARIHPETGRTAIFVGMHASHIEGMPFELGRALVLRLEEHATQTRYQYRHSWRLGDMLMWDNRCLLHRAEANFNAEIYPRILHRTCLRGTPTNQD